MLTILDLEKPAEWPEELKVALAEVRPVMRAWELDLPGKNGQDFDAATATLTQALLPYSIRGWHCTRLTDEEVADVTTNGLSILSADLAKRRIATQLQRGAFQDDVSTALLAGHQASASNREGMIWLCFFPPREAGEGGIANLLRHWGGEAIYWAHVTDRAIAPTLYQLGTPCIVEADVPVSLLARTFISITTSFARRDLIHQGETIKEPVRFEGYCRQAIPGACIRAVHRFPDARFVALSGCNSWHTPLR